MPKIPDWFDEKCLETDAKALGTYMALLYIRFIVTPVRESHKDKESVLKCVANEIGTLLEGISASQAWDSAQEFLERLYANEYLTDEHRFKDPDRMISLLEDIERTYYERFEKACYGFFSKAYIDYFESEYGKDLTRALARLLIGAKMRAFSLTISGSVYIYKFYNFVSEELMGKSERELTKDELKRVTDIITVLIRSRILWFKCIIPAPFLRDEFIMNKLGVNIKPNLEPEVKQM